MKGHRLIRGTVDGAHMLWKRLLSYRKREWRLSDYPIRMRVQKDVEQKDRYWARVLGWCIDATGATPVEALAELQCRFEERKANLAEEGKLQPRPGTRVPIEFASQESINSHGKLIDDFIVHVLELEWAFISDESSLGDFHTEDTNEKLNAKIKQVYGVDVSDIESGSISEILDRIALVKGEQSRNLV